MNEDVGLNVEAILKQFASFQVEVVMIGGLAMRAHGSAHLTEDADFSYRRTKENIEALAQAMAPLHPYLRGAPKGLPFRFDPPTIQADMNFTLTSDCGAIDFLGHISGIGEYAKVLELSEEKTLFGLSIRVLSIEGLIAAKQAAGRNKDKSHLLELEELKKMRDAQT